MTSPRRVGPPHAADFRLRAEVEVTDARNVESQIAFEVSDRRARGTVVPTGPDSFLSSEMNAQAEGRCCGEEVSVGGPAFVFSPISASRNSISSSFSAVLISA